MDVATGAAEAPADIGSGSYQFAATIATISMMIIIVRPSMGSAAVSNSRFVAVLLRVFWVGHWNAGL
jgi:hypothetical protein